MRRLMTRAAAALCVCLVASVFHTARATDRVLSWDPVTTDSSGNPLPAGVTVTYNVYGAPQGTALKLLANVTTTTNTRTNVDVGTACYAVTALVTPAGVVTNQESAQSPMVCDTVAAGAPPPVQTPAAPAAPGNFKVQQVPSPPTS